MRLDEALSQVKVLKRQVVLVQRFRCYRWNMVALTGAVGILGAVNQQRFVGDARHHVMEYVSYWIVLAAIALTVVGSEILAKYVFVSSAYERRQTRTAILQFAPCLTVGAAMTLGIVTACPEHAELLPAMWAMCFSLGLFASCTQLPRAMFAVAAFYLVAGVVLLRVATDTSSFTPWAMGITFGGGQWLTAVVLWTDRS